MAKVALATEHFQHFVGGLEREFSGAVCRVRRARCGSIFSRPNRNGSGTSIWADGPMSEVRWAGASVSKIQPAMEKSNLNLFTRAA